MSEATIEYKNSPNESTAYVVSEGQKTKVQLVATPAGDLELANSPNVDTGYLVINGEKHKCALVAEVAGELKLPTSATDDTGYVTTQDGRQHKVRLIANITGGSDEPVDKAKFGVTIDNFLGDVDADGNYVAPTESFEVNLAGVKSVPEYGFFYSFARKNVTKFLCNDVTYVGAFGFSYASNANPVNTVPVIIEFNSLEEVTEDSAFAYFCTNRTYNSTILPYFNALKVISGVNSFSYFASLQGIDVPSTFPVLEEIKGNSCMNNFCSFNRTETNLLFPKVKKITGASGQYTSTFGYTNLVNSVWKFPEATELSGYIWTDAGGTSNAKLHFAAANQAAIEACEGYSYKWGLTGATIYFDL